jgi:hypothetical protein
MAIVMVMGMAMTFMAAAIFTPTAACMLFLVRNNHLAGIRANLQPLAADHVDILPWQDSHSHQIPKGLPRIRRHFGDTFGMNKNITAAPIIPGHGRGQPACGFHGKLSGKMNVQVPIALISFNATYCFHVTSPD